MRRMVSIVCAEQSDLDAVLTKIELSDIEGYHIDIVDKDIDDNGNVQNDLFIHICKNSKKLKEIHMLMDNVYSCIRSVCALKPDFIYISSCCNNIDEIYEIIRSNGIDLGIYIESDSIIDDSEIDRLLSYSTHFMILTVEPKSMGGTWLPFAENNIKAVLARKQDIEVGMDGACSIEVMNHYSGLGVDAFVLGTKSGFFNGFRVKKGMF